MWLIIHGPYMIHVYGECLLDMLLIKLVIFRVGDILRSIIFRKYLITNFLIKPATYPLYHQLSGQGGDMFYHLLYHELNYTPIYDMVVSSFRYSVICPGFTRWYHIPLKYLGLITDVFSKCSTKMMTFIQN